MTGRLFVPALVLTSLAIAALCFWMLPPFTLFLVGQVAILVIVTVALTVLIGGAGILAVSSSAFMAVGGYGTIIVMNQFQLPLVPAIFISCILAAAIGFALGLVALRVSGFYLAVLTLAFLQMLLSFLKRGGDLTGGGYGLVVPLVSLPLVGAYSTALVATTAIGFAVATAGLCGALMKSRVGRAWVALRDHEPGARVVGIDVSSLKLAAYVFTSVVIALAGALHALLLGVTNPAAYQVDSAIFHITLVAVGGMTGSIAGAVVSPFLLFLLPDLFHSLADWREHFYSVLLLLVLIFAPQGLAPLMTRLGNRLLRSISG